jgi:hypothetical protein
MALSQWELNKSQPIEIRILQAEYEFYRRWGINLTHWRLEKILDKAG